MKLNREIWYRRSLWMPGWGEISLSALLIGLFSGLLLIPFFNSPQAPFEALTRLISSGFFGRWLHRVHDLSGDIFLITMTLHLLEYIDKKSYREYLFKPWILLVLLGVSGLWLVFSGFLSQGSLESESAVRIWFGILSELPWIGRTLIQLLFGSDGRSVIFPVIYQHHAVSLTILTLLLTFLHIQRLKAERYTFYYTLSVITILSLLLPPDIGRPLNSPAFHISGPWYFSGLQEMLIWLPVWLTGFVFPLAAILLLMLLQRYRNFEKIWLVLLTVLAVFYLAETIIGLFLRGSDWPILMR